MILSRPVTPRASGRPTSTPRSPTRRSGPSRPTGPRRRPPRRSRPRESSAHRSSIPSRAPRPPPRDHPRMRWPRIIGPHEHEVDILRPLALGEGRTMPQNHEPGRRPRPGRPGPGELTPPGATTDAWSNSDCETGASWESSHKPWRQSHRRLRTGVYITTPAGEVTDTMIGLRGGLVLRRAVGRMNTHRAGGVGQGTTPPGPEPALASVGTGVRLSASRAYIRPAVHRPQAGVVVEWGDLQIFRGSPDSTSRTRGPLHQRPEESRR